MILIISWQVFKSDDPLDSKDFNPVDYINAIFPTEQVCPNFHQILSLKKNTICLIVIYQHSNWKKKGKICVIVNKKFQFSAT